MLLRRPVTAPAGPEEHREVDLWVHRKQSGNSWRHLPLLPVSQITVGGGQLLPRRPRVDNRSRPSVIRNQAIISSTDFRVAPGGTPRMLRFQSNSQKWFSKARTFTKISKLYAAHDRLLATLTKESQVSGCSLGDDEGAIVQVVS